MRHYGQFCPVAIASEVLAQRWTPLVLRELLSGSRHFNELRRGVPLMSPSLLSERLQTLEEFGIVTRCVGKGAKQTEYRLTPAGEELRPIIEQIGTWGRRWLQHEIRTEQLDPALLMWDMQRRINVPALPGRRVVVRFEYTDVPAELSLWWLVLETGQVDLCLKDPGFSADLQVRTTVRLMTRIWLGEVDLRRALGPELVVRGPRVLVRSLPDWLQLSLFATVERVRTTTRAVESGDDGLGG